MSVFGTSIAGLDCDTYVRSRLNPAVRKALAQGMRKGTRFSVTETDKHFVRQMLPNGDGKFIITNVDYVHLRDALRRQVAIDERTVREACKFCGLQMEDAAAANIAGTIGVTLAGLLTALEAAAEEQGRDDPDVEEGYRLARNGAGIARAMHSAAHGDETMASHLRPAVEPWLETAAANIEAAHETPEAFDAAAQSLGGHEAAGVKARWMVDNVTWNDRGEAILPREVT